MRNGLPAEPNDVDASIVIELQYPTVWGALTDRVTPIGALGATTEKLVTVLPPHDDKMVQPSNMPIEIEIIDAGVAVAPDPNNNRNVVLDNIVHIGFSPKTDKERGSTIVAHVCSDIVNAKAIEKLNTRIMDKPSLAKEAKPYGPDGKQPADKHA